MRTKNPLKMLFRKSSKAKNKTAGTNSSGKESDDAETVRTSVSSASRRDSSVQMMSQSLQHHTYTADTPRIALAKAYLQKWNEHDMAGSEDLLTEDYSICFQDDMEMPYGGFKEEMQKIFDSFPDFTFEFKDIKERDDGVVVLHKMIPSGHHTGKPYGFGPCDPIEPSGKHVTNEPETIHYYFSEDGTKICKQVVYPLGEMTGPQGIYTQLGGFPFM